LPYKVINGIKQQGVTGFTAYRGINSEKPEEMRHMIEKVSYPPFVEIFAKKSDTDDIFNNDTNCLWNKIEI
jgi:hypothetical protein